jgi:hypothetical protein
MARFSGASKLWETSHRTTRKVRCDKGLEIAASFYLTEQNKPYQNRFEKYSGLNFCSHNGWSWNDRDDRSPNPNLAPPTTH